jgi:hypothetical protein
MVRKILIKDIKIERELRPGDDLSGLKKEGFNTHDQAVILYKGKLIDGLRRIRALEDWNVTTVWANDSSSLEETADLLSKAHPTPVTNWWRVYEITTDLRAIVQDRVRELRAKAQSGKPPHSPWDPSLRRESSRTIITRALGGVGAAQWEKLVRIIETGEQTMVDRVMRGELTPAAAYSRLERKRKARLGDVKTPAEQIHLLDKVAQQLRIASTLLQKVSYPVQLNPEDSSRLAADLRKHRAMLAPVIRQLEEAAKK